MKLLLQTTDVLLLMRAKETLIQEGIEAFSLDEHMSVLEGSLGILPRRLMVRDGDEARARRILADLGLLNG